MEKMKKEIYAFMNYMGNEIRKDDERKHNFKK